MNKVAPLQDFDDPTYDPFVVGDASYGNEILDPWPMFRDMAAKTPVIEADFRKLMNLPEDLTLTPGDRLFIVFDSDAVRGIMTNPELFTNAHIARMITPIVGRLALSSFDPPEHTRYRRLYQRAFLPTNVATWNEAFIAPAINDLIDTFIDQGRVDIMATFVSKYPFDVIFRQMGLPPAEGRLFHKLSIAMQLAQVDPAHGQEAHDKLGAYLKALLDERRRNPGNDLISVLGTAELDGERLPDDSVISFFRLILGAAGDTAYRTTGSLLVALLSERPDQFEMVKANRALIPAAIEEALRWEGPVSVSYRSAARDVEVGGTMIPAGAIVQVVTGMANRDPAVYPDPDRYDLTRTFARPHLGFGAGPHICLGQHLARTEMAKAVNILLDRLPELRLDADYPRPAIVGAFMRAPRRIHVRFD
jgi:cytochrome P450